MLAFLAPAPACRSRPHRALTSFALLVAAVVGPACHDATGPKPNLAPTPSFTIVSGNAQTGPAGIELSQAIVAKATNGSGTPIVGLTLFFVVTQGGGKLYAGGGVTNSSGDVQDYWTLGPGVGAHKVEVRAVDPTTGVKNSYATFTATAVAGPAAIIKLSAGDKQTAFTRAQLPIKPAVLVTDAFGNPVAGVPINFAVSQGAGSVSGPTPTTSASGIATVGNWRLGRAPGTNNNRLTVTGVGLIGSPVTFTASSKFGMSLVATGREQSCGLSAANDVYCWGYNLFGQVGDGTTDDRFAPVKMASNMLPPKLALGDLYGCLLISSGKAHCWGYNGVGSLGNGTTADSDTPVAVSGAVSFTSIAAGHFTTCGLTSAGAVWCWGYNANGQFGDGTANPSNVPVPAAGVHTFRSIYLGGFHACALTESGIAWCWGNNGAGQLGDLTVTDRPTPTLVAGGLTFTSLEMGIAHSCGLVAAGKAYCWGRNLEGEVGDATTTNALSPKPVSGGIAFTQLAAGRFHTCGITAAGVAYCWGENIYGELGVGGISTSSAVPNLVAGGRTFSSISAGASEHTCAVPAGGGIPFCWGRNANGQLGNGSTLDASLPVELLTPAIP